MELDALLIDSGHKYRKEVLMMPIAALKQKALGHMTLRKGVRGKETVGGVKDDSELRPYKSEKGGTDSGSIIARTLETFLGDVVEEFDPYKLFATVFGEQFSDLTKRTDAEIVKKMCLAKAKTISKKLGKALWNGKRNPEGTKTADLFDGFDTITAKEIAAGNIATGKGNLVELVEMNESNVGDVLHDFYAAASEELQDADGLKLFIPKAVKEMYEKWCKAEFGAAVYNTSYNKNVLHGTEDNPVELVALAGMKDNKHIYLTTKSNMLVGCDQQSADEKFKIRECDNPKAVQFFMCMFFGVQFEFIEQERLLVGKIYAAG